VTLIEPDFAGSYVVVEWRQDGLLVLEPKSVNAVVEEFADRVLTEAEHDDVFRRLDAAADRDGHRFRVSPTFSVTARAARE